MLNIRSNFFFALGIINSFLLLCPSSLSAQEAFADDSISDRTRNALIIGTGIAVGAGGVVAGYALSKRGHHHHSSCSSPSVDSIPRPPGPQGPQGVPGPAGPAGTSPFIPLEGSLVFDNSAAFGDVSLGIFPVTLTPFVAIPDGTVIQGTSLTVTGPSVTGSYDLEPITVLNPVIGEYQTGVVYYYNTGVSIFLQAEISSTVLDTSGRGPVVTTLTTPTTNYTTGTGVVQITLPFTYVVNPPAPDPTPPSS